MAQPTRLELLRMYLQEDPNDAFTKYALALELIKIDDNEEAELLMADLYIQNSEYLANYYHYGKLLESRGKKELAGVVYKRGMEIARNQGNQHTLAELNAAFEDLY